MPARATSCGDSPTTLLPIAITLPPRAGMSPEMDRRMLVLPAPLAPSSTNTMPSSTLKETSRTANRSP
jgi:hypothetical protein